MILAAIVTSFLGLRTVSHASMHSFAGMSREQVVRELGLKRPKAKLSPEQMKAGYLALLKGDPTEKTIALTFDDGPHGPVTDRLLDVLKQYHVPCTFFVVGKMAAKYPELIRRESWDGHLVENHTFTHPCLEGLTTGQVMDEYQKCNDIVKKLTGRTPKYCRPPGGDFNDSVLKAATDLNLITTLWTDDPGDYQRLPVPTIIQKVLTTAHPGGIILLHDGIPETIEALPTIIDTLRSRGYRFVSVNELEVESVQANAKRPVAKPTGFDPWRRR
jgi:peptidoglycan-N-acetylglucosamine deacetylase